MNAADQIFEQSWGALTEVLRCLQRSLSVEYAFLELRTDRTEHWLAQPELSGIGTDSPPSQLRCFGGAAFV